MADVYCPLSNKLVEVHRCCDDEEGDVWTCPECKSDITLGEDRHLYHRPGQSIICPVFDGEVFVWTDEDAEYECNYCEASIAVHNGMPVHGNVVEIACARYPRLTVVVPIDDEDHLECPHCGGDIDVLDGVATHSGATRQHRSDRTHPDSANSACKGPTDAFDESSHGRVLGLRGRVTLAEIKRNYRERMQEYHPDKVASLGLKLRTVAEEETKRINAAYEFFINKYDRRDQT